MNSSKSSIWIDKEFKPFYRENNKSGIALYNRTELPKDLRDFIPLIISWLRKKYYFPIRCSIFLRNLNYFRSSQNATPCRGVFFAPEDETKSVPQIYIAIKSMSTYEFAFTLVHELTHYYQWYFMEDERRTDKSLEIEANRYANYLCDLFSDETGYPNNI